MLEDLTFGTPPEEDAPAVPREWPEPLGDPDDDIEPIEAKDDDVDWDDPDDEENV